MEISYAQKWMSLALQEARLAASKGEVPVGAVVVKEDQLIAKAHNLREIQNSAIAHAEILAIESANQSLKGWRLSGCDLFVTLEPCIMCCGAIISSRISRVCFAASDPKSGAASSLYKLLSDERLNHQCEVISGVLGQESSEELTKFFKNLRLTKEVN